MKGGATPLNGQSNELQAAHAAIDRARAWLCDAALPLWRERGWHAAHGGFVERLDAAGTPDLDTPRRMRVQARQIFVYASAARRGWCDGKAAEQGLDWFLPRCWAADGAPGFVHLLNADGSLNDGRRDAYDQAFALLALAAAYRLTGEAKLRQSIDAAVAFTDAALRDDRGAWRESASGGLPRRQNPQMHAFETMLALFDATGDERFLGRARAILALFRTTLVDPGSGAVTEYFDDNWSPLPGDDGRICEPGHQLEWIWLLSEYARLTGEATPVEAERLWRWTAAHGLNAEGWAIDECDANGTSRLASRRLWPQTELVKALLTRAEAGDTVAFCRAASVLDRLAATYLDVPVRGGWVDRYDAAGAVSDPLMPASSFYHLYIAIAEADRVAGKMPAALADMTTASP